MLCDICKKREAKIYYTEIINGEKQEQHLCEECAAEHTSFVIKNGSGKELTLGGLLSGLLLGAAGAQTEKQNDHVCPVCGLGYEEFLKQGRFGCAACYRAFGLPLEKLLKNIHGADRHCGKQLSGCQTIKQQEKSKEPALSELERLSLQLQQAIEKEEFEEAARLRDKIREQREKEQQVIEKKPEYSKKEQAASCQEHSAPGEEDVHE